MQAFSYKDWHIPYQHDDITLARALTGMRNVTAAAEDVPLMVQLVENPKFRMPGFEIFHGAVDLQQHDCIHIILGRGLLEMDEAFTIGFTMGSTQKVSTTEERLYSFIAQYLYPNVYKFSSDDIAVFKDAVRLAGIMQCAPLDKFEFRLWRDKPLRMIREAIGLESALLLDYYRLEQRRYPQSIASQRLLTDLPVTGNS